MEPDEKHKNKGTQLERALNSLFFEDEDSFWPDGWWGEEEEESGNKNSGEENHKTGGSP
jgi:hypothetical protein